MRAKGRIYKRVNGSLLWIAYQQRGKEIRESSKSSDPEQAQIFLEKRLREIENDREGINPFVGPQQDRLTVGKMLDALETDYKLNGGRGLPEFKAHLKPVRKYFGDTKANKVTARMIDRYIESRLAEKRLGSTVNRETALLRHAFRLAIDNKILSASPKIRRLKESTPRAGFFGLAEFDRTVGFLPSHLQGFARFGFLCGWRKSELRSLAWVSVDGRELRLGRDHSKNGIGRVLVLEGELWTIIERQRKLREYKNADGTVAFSSYVFHIAGQPIGDFRKAWATACKKAAVPGKLFHDLRRTAVRNMRRAHVSEGVAMLISGHRTRSIFDRYNIIDDHELGEAMAQTQAYLSSLPRVPTLRQ
jgi:integrase